MNNQYKVLCEACGKNMFNILRGQEDIGLLARTSDGKEHKICGDCTMIAFRKILKGAKNEHTKADA